MGNYKQVEIEFIERTLELIQQYEAIKVNYPFEKQFNHTLIINCLLGLVVMPKEKSYELIKIKKDEFYAELKTRGVCNSTFNPDLDSTQNLFHRLRNAIAHFGIKFLSENEKKLIDWIEFKDRDFLVAKIDANELLPFLRYFAESMINLIQRAE